MCDIQPTSCFVLGNSRLVRQCEHFQRCNSRLFKVTNSSTFCFREWFISSLPVSCRVKRQYSFTWQIVRCIAPVDPILFLKINWTVRLSRFIFNDLVTLFCSEETPLHFASEGGHVEICQYLIASKADVDTKNHKCDASVTDTIFVFESFLLKMHFGNVFPIAWCIVVFQKSDPPQKSYRKQQNRCRCLYSERLSARVSSSLAPVAYIPNRRFFSVTEENVGEGESEVCLRKWN